MTVHADLRVGLVGFGAAGKIFHAPLLRATPGLQLAAVASSDAGRRSARLLCEVAITPA